MTDTLTPFTSPRVVLAHLKPLHDILVPSLGYCCRRSTEYFREQNLEFEPGLHSYLTRHRLLHILRRKSISAVVDQDGSEYTTEGQSLCGIRIETDQCIAKLLKLSSQKREIPASTTDQRKDFYQANLGFGSPGNNGGDQKVHLLLLWNANDEHELSSFAVACPYGMDDRRPQKKWWKTLDMNSFTLPEEPKFDALEPDLNEITPKLPSGEKSAKPAPKTQTEDQGGIRDEGTTVGE